MKLFGFFKRAASGAGTAAIQREFDERGLRLRFAQVLREVTPRALLDAVDGASPDDTILAAHLAQLAEEGLAELRADHALIPWASVYDLQEDAEHEGFVQRMSLPATRGVCPLIDCRSTLSESTFNLEVDSWVESGIPLPVDGIVGAVAHVNGEPAMLPRPAWAMCDAIAQFSRRGESERTQHDNELAWGRIRTLADAAGAYYKSPYLETTYVVTPQTLRLPLTREQTRFGRVVTVTPTFENAPPGWIDAFDAFDAVREHYDLKPPGGGRLRVVISQPVRRVLEVIKRDMPGRKVAGSRAERFIHNPFAYLGDTAHDVIREEEFQEDRAQAGSVAAVFSVEPRYQNGRIEVIDLIVTESFVGGVSSTDIKQWATPVELEKFIGALRAGLEREGERFAWDEYDLTLDGDSSRQLENAQQTLALWRLQPAETISMDDVYELSGYSERIQGIGVAGPIYVPVFQKPSDEDEGEKGWLPSDLGLAVRIHLEGHDGQVVIPLTKEWVGEFEQQVLEAEKSGAEQVENAELPTPVATAQARALVDGFRTMLDAQERVKTDGAGKAKERKPERETLLVKTNFHETDYVEEWRDALTLPADARAELPAALRAGIEPKKHQLHGVAWFQNLLTRGRGACRGALLADDMGLGKTMHLLIVLAWHYEHRPDAPPTLVVAPKSLLENWKSETSKFFTPSFPEVLVLYGAELAARKQPLGLIDSQLQAKGVTDLLRPGWCGNAKVIITTYEVLTNFEFSLARQPFSFVICDEAQRIKTPGTQVTLAVKKLKAEFRIACTGTPVENSLADLWCLFDFVQPGLLGALETFGRTYRRPIECQSDQDHEALQLLQETIAPQTLRRTKADIKDELKRKFFGVQPVGTEKLVFKEMLEAKDRLEVSMSQHQRLLYLGGLKKLRDAVNEKDGRKRATLSFGALHLMKAVCAEPYCLPGSRFVVDGQGQGAHLLNSPKMGWLVERLQAVKASGEKAIIFTELREVQAALFYFMREVFGLKPFIINGDSQNRQSYIAKFSEAPGFDVIILSTLAAGAGLNVVAANHVFHFTRAWNPAKENQATDRAYRIGQERDVFVYAPVTVTDEFPTFDVRLDELMKRKGGLADATIGGSGMVSMLNGAGRDISMIGLFGEDPVGVAPPGRNLTIDDVDRLDGYGFEAFCRLLWSKRGYQAHLTPKGKGDGGIDVVALNGRTGELLQCKSSQSPEVGWDAVKEVTAGAAGYQRKFASTKFRRLAVTNKRFNNGAREQARFNQVELIERSDFEILLSKYPISSVEFDEEMVEASMQ